MKACSCSGLLDDGTEMSGLRPHVYTHTVSSTTCAEFCSLRHGKHIQNYIIGNGFFLHSLLGNFLTAVYPKCVAFDHSLRDFIYMVEREVGSVSWNCVLCFGSSWEWEGSGGTI